MAGAAAVDWANFLATWLKFPNLTRVKVGYDETTGLYFMAARLRKHKQKKMNNHVYLFVSSRLHYQAEF